MRLANTILLSAVMISSTFLPTRAQSTQTSPFLISKETTHILDPIQPNGVPDYIAAYNSAILNIPTDQNAATLILEASGPLTGVDEKQIAKYFPTFSAAKSQHIQAPYEFVQSLSAEERQTPTADILNKAHKLNTLVECSLISEADAPLSRWIEAQQQPMARLEKAATRTHCAFPLIPKTTTALWSRRSPRFLRF